MRLENETAADWYNREAAANRANRPKGKIGGPLIGGSVEAHSAMMAEQGAARRQTAAEADQAREQARVKSGRPVGAIQANR